MPGVHSLDAVPGRYVFACRIEYLPDLTSDPGRFGGLGNPIIEGYARQLAFLRALTAHASGTCALQLRFVSRQDSGQPVDVLILGSSQGLSQAYELLEFVQNLMPSEVPIQVVQDEDQVAGLWFPFGEGATFTAATFAEIRRATEPLDPAPDAPRTDLYDLALLDWGWSPHSLTHSLELMRQQRGTTMLGVTVQPTSVHPEVYTYLTEGVTRFQEQLKSEWENPLVVTARNVYFDRARRLRQAALHLRVFMASDQPLLAGAPEFFGADLSRRSDSSGLHPQAFEVIRPRTAIECDQARAMVDRLEGPIWGCHEDADENLQELTFMVDPLEAHTAFRIPLTPAGGLAGLATARVGSFSRGTQVRHGSLIKPLVVLGTNANLDSVGLTAQDINEHILVGGVPGSGKSTTVQSILRAMHSESIPFLVLDPAKTDYAKLGDIAKIFDLTPDAIGFNPLAVPESCSIRSYQTRLLGALDSGLRLSERWPLGRVIAGLALSATYQRASLPKVSVPGIEWPTLADLYRQTKAIIREQGFTGQAASDARAAVLSRIEFMIDGPFGELLSGDSTAAINWSDLLGSNSVIQMRQVGGPDERALVFGLLLAGLVSFREANPYQRHDTPYLGHVTVLEEAHRILGREEASSYTANLFSAAIAELRSSGEGFIVVDQAPSQLIQGVTKNTGSRIAHRISDYSERQSMSDTMTLSESQGNDMARLPSGKAIIQAGSLLEPVLIDVMDHSRGAEFPPAGPSTSLAPSGAAIKTWCQRCPKPCEADPNALSVQVLETYLPAPSDYNGMTAYIRQAATYLDVAIPSKTLSLSVMQLYCNSVKALSDSFERGDPRHSRALFEHLRAFDEVASQ